jgi:hypothetical protein
MKRITIFICILVASSTLLSCSGYKHLQIAKKHTEKAFKKDPSLNVGNTDTLIVEKFDTIRGIDGKDSIIYRDREVTLPCAEIDLSNIKSNVQIRQENKTARVELKQDGRTERTEVKQSARVDKVNVKQEGKTNRTESRQENKRSSWYIWLIVGFFLHWLLVRFKTKNPNFGEFLDNKKPYQ